MILQLMYYSYYINYALYFLATYYIFGTINLSHDIYTKFKTYDNHTILLLVANVDEDWIVIEN
jgi:hypothetical protein